MVAYQWSKSEFAIWERARCLIEGISIKAFDATPIKVVFDFIIDLATYNTGLTAEASPGVDSHSVLSHCSPLRLLHFDKNVIERCV